ncbi:unnamed protein product [Phytomonas sp. EM1]|nr:unnamed protein product [Phytomonas sp. EM1]|eukprot:CCW64263.1 unnamed protein product [Phytomonas sp. isolate EM1]
MSGRLSPKLFNLQQGILKEAVRFVPETGFTNLTLLSALKAYSKTQNVTDSAISKMFNRGFPIILVEFIVRESNAYVQNELLKKYNKESLFRMIQENEDNYLSGRYRLPEVKEVAVDSITYKLSYLNPFLEQWPNAVALEYSVSNIPYTMLNFAQFTDTAAHVMERVENFANIMEPIRNILNSKKLSHFIPTDVRKTSDCGNKYTNNMVFMRTSIQGVPLSSGPHMGESSFSFPWFTKRAKVAALYSLSMTSVLGDTSFNKNETKNLLMSIADTIF